MFLLVQSYGYDGLSRPRKAITHGVGGFSAGLVDCVYAAVCLRLVVYISTWSSRRLVEEGTMKQQEVERSAVWKLKIGIP